MNRTKIEWVKNPDGTQGWTWNKVTGCLGPNGTPDYPLPCSYCYAHRLARGRLKKRYLTGFSHIIPGGDPKDPFTPRYWPDRAIEPYKLKKPSTIFVCSMAELFGDFVPDDWIDNVLATCWDLPQHTFQILTKNPKRAQHFSFPFNVWLGVTVVSRRDWFRVPLLLRSNAKVKFISFEPLLWHVFRDEDLPVFSGFPYVDWIIIGAQTQPVHIPPAPWVSSIIDAARHEGIPIFLKDNLHWPERIQEFPKRPKVGTNSQNSSGIPGKSGEPSHAKWIHRGSPNDKIPSPSQGQHLHSDKEAK